MSEQQTPNRFNLEGIYKSLASNEELTIGEEADIVSLIEMFKTSQYYKLWVALVERNRRGLERSVIASRQDGQHPEFLLGQINENMNCQCIFDDFQKLYEIKTEKAVNGSDKSYLD